MSKYLLAGAGLTGAAILILAVAIYLLTFAPAPLSTVKTFVASVETNDFDAAYATYHADLKQRQPFPEFVEAWSRRSSSLELANRSWSTDVENETAEVSGRFSAPGREDWSATFQLIKQDDVWQITDYEVQDGSSVFRPGA